ncbi:MAG: hypothetical protein P1U88_19375 [Thalassobaculaceae bacterium]|nr:hypothetical protein [Thalassobaculaceae bacterium]
MATPIGAHGTARGSAARGNPLLERGDSFRRPLFTTWPTASFLAQAIAQDTGASGTRPQSAEAARLYRSVQETVDRDVARRTGRPGIDVVT